MGIRDLGVVRGRANLMRGGIRGRVERELDLELRGRLGR